MDHGSLVFLSGVVSAVDVITAVLVAITLFGVVPLLIGANGNRPFIVGYVGFAILLGMVTTHALWTREDIHPELIRLAAVIWLLFTVGWAYWHYASVARKYRNRD